VLAAASILYASPTLKRDTTYTGDTSKWEFAIFKWSTERYDPDEWFFPGSECVDGTVEGAMMAGLHAYPV
jgi:hypothetical protein